MPPCLLPCGTLPQLPTCTSKCTSNCFQDFNGHYYMQRQLLVIRDRTGPFPTFTTLIVHSHPFTASFFYLWLPNSSLKVIAFFVFHFLAFFADFSDLFSVSSVFFVRRTFAKEMKEMIVVDHPLVYLSPLFSSTCFDQYSSSSSYSKSSSSSSSTSSLCEF